ncbi:hypothetical protein ASG01_10315 [Chryseobacterium sp. Leaf180]|jgi:hypothetical protein|uniref:hypothetical protein n=1 Tax=Chryseobacterium sp. Leaf180 TaxID=1736289 RepID=UPI0006FE6EB5|nr:hypothetical protein [Chryseobacterium sp. Leaf180]KQR93553.1 hypothetical protein ASG01_10315 [Chryseobacterium sp. Leaf180]
MLKPNIIIFAVLVAGFIAYNFFFPVADGRLHTVINIVYASVLFAYIAFMAFRMLKQLKK